MKRGKKLSAYEALLLSSLIVSLMFVVAFLDFTQNLPLEQLGILPRTWTGLRGIIFSPFLHYNAAHLLANAFPLFVLLLILFLHRDYQPATTLFLIWALSGFGTWIIGRYALHIGASSLIFGLAAYLVTAGFLIKSWRAAVIALMVFIAYGGIFLGVLPQNGTVSWEGHLCGTIAGILVARHHHA